MKDCFSKKLCLLMVTLFIATHSWGDKYSSFSLLESNFTIRYNGQFSDDEKRKLYRWLTQATKAVTTLYGRFPENNIRIKLVRSRASEPVPWGEVKRGSSPQVIFHVNPRYPLIDFQQDWVAVHEFSHLLLPYAGNDDAWISEGLATYYQNVLRARHGMISEKMAWRKLIEGFQRGEKDTNYQHLTLGELSPIMRDTGSYMRVYWSGAAYFFNADIKIRQLTNGDLSLDKVLDKFNRCCKHISRNWRASQIMRKMDDIADVDLFYSLYLKYKKSYNIPSTKKDLNLLGVRMVRGNIEINPKAVWSEMRQNIM